MSEVAETRRDSRGNGGGSNSSRPGGGNGSQPPSSNENFSQNQAGNSSHAQQDFSWRVGQQQQMQEAYNNFYYPGAAAAAGYSPFSAGDIRDSIAAIWSRTSPSGEGFAAASGGYGQGGEGFAAAAAGQFAANLNFAPTSELSMFGAAAAGAAAGDYSAAYGQGYGFGPQYTQWPDNNAGGGANSGGNTVGKNSNNSNSSSRNYSYLSGGGRAGDLMDVQHGLDGMKLTNSRKDNNGGAVKSGGGQSGSSGSSGGGGGGGKMSWASVASQPAKPQPQPKALKKPGVLPPPSIISSNTAKAPPVQTPQQTPTEKMMNIPPPPSTSQQMLMQQPPPQVPPPNMPPVMNNHHDNNGGGNTTTSNSGFRGPPPSMSNSGGNSGGSSGRSMMGASNQGPRASNRGPQTVNGSVTGGKAAMSHSVSPSQAMSHPILDNLRSVNEYNPKSFDMSPKNARYFVIKSFSEDDIHRSIKYEIWCSTEHGNKRLDAAYKAQNSQGPIFLFFSVNGSGHFCGMAEMLSGVDYTNTGSSVWVQDKFKGQFKVRWIYVKDVPNSQLRHIRLENNENKPVTNSRDTQEVPPEKGKMVLKIIHSYKHSTSLFDDFVHYEKKQEEEDKKKQHSDHQPHHREHHYRGGGDREHHGHHDERGGHRRRGAVEQGGEPRRGKPPKQH